MYSAQISRINPTLMLFIIDQSGSMEDRIGGNINLIKAEAVADAFNKTIFQLVVANSQGEKILDRFYVGIVGYGFGDEKFGSIFKGPLTGNEIVSISELGHNPIDVEQRTKKVYDGAGGLVDEITPFPIWIRPVAIDGTPMRQALEYSKTIVEKWINEHSDCFPPIIIHITDGESTDGDPRSVAESIKSLSTSDGNVLLFNLHLSSTNSSKIEFPNSTNNLPDKFAKLLYEMSSEFPDTMINLARFQGFDQISKGSRGFVFNGDIESIVRFLLIGTIAVLPQGSNR